MGFQFPLVFLNGERLLGAFNGGALLGDVYGYSLSRWCR